MKPFLKQCDASVRLGVRLAAHAAYGWLCVAVTAQTVTAGTWLPIGPRGDLGTADGEVCNGRIASIQIHETSGTLYVGASSGGIWRTDPGTGRPPVWEDLGKNLPHPSVGALAVHPLNPDDILAGTGDSGREADPGGGFAGGTGLFHTTDAGGHWTEVLVSTAQLLFPPATFYRVLYQPGSHDVILAATNLGLFRSEGGPSGPWAQVQTSGSFTDLVFDPSNASIAFACIIGGPQGTGLYRSSDAGRNWQEMLSMNQGARGAVAICRHAPNVIATAWESGSSVTAILRSVNGGQNWSSIGGTGGNADPSVLAIAIAPNDANQVYVGSTGLWWTLNGGQTWELTSPRPIAHHADITQLYFSPLDDSGLWFCSDSGVYRYQLGDNHSVSFNGTSTDGLQVSQIYRVQARRNLRFAAMQDDGINGSIDGGASWKPFHEGADVIDGFDVTIASPSDTDPAFWFIYGVAHGGAPVARSSFTGPLQVVTNPAPVPKISGLYYDRFSDAPAGRVFAARWTSQSGASQLLSYPVGAMDSSEARVEASGPVGVEGITGSNLNGQTFYLWVKKVDLVTVVNKFNVLVFRRSGPGWAVTQQLIGAPGAPRNVLQVIASRQWPGEAWATLAGAQNDAKVFHSIDYGITWTNISGDSTASLTGRPIGNVNTLAVSPCDPNELYAGTGRGGVFRSLDAGKHWEPFQDGLPLVSVTDMVYVPDESHFGTDKLVIGTYGRGMYERALDRVGPVYVDQRNTTPPWLGTLEHPDQTIAQGISDTPFGGRMLLNGSVVYSGSRSLSKQMTTGSYEFWAHVGP
jgi:hypothetical protein